MQDRGENDAITVGGIGSIHVKDAEIPDHHSGHNDVGVAALQAQNIQTMEVHSSQLAAMHSQIGQGKFSSNQDYLYPNAVASLDDWTFQGCDTAFFDVLMGGVGDQQPSTNGTESLIYFASGSKIEELTNHQTALSLDSKGKPRN